MLDFLTQAAVTIDADTVAFYLEVPRNHVVLLQVYFELYEGLATVRTLDKTGGVVCVLTTPSLIQDCLGVLHAIKEHVAWSPCSKVPTDALGG